MEFMTGEEWREGISGKTHEPGQFLTHERGTVPAGGQQMARRGGRGGVEKSTD